MNDTSARKIHVGISVFAVAGAHLWASGLNQNLAFLVMLLRQSEQIGRIVLLNGGDQEQLPEGLDFDGFDLPLVRPEDVTYELDLVIEMGAQLPLEWLRHVRALGTRIVTFFVGHTYADLGESPIFERHSGHIFNGTPRHEVWILPHHAKTCGPLLRTVTRVPIRVMPHIWAPNFIERRVRECEAAGYRFGFQPPTAGAERRGWRAAIFEPNISVVKNCVVPMLVCEETYRTEPSALELMMVMNSFHMKEHPTFNRFAINLDLTRRERASYEPRLDFADCMARHEMNMVVSHQWECGLNYLYYDALYGGYPLVHNSEYLQRAGVGLFYPGFEARAGASRLLDAWTQDAAYWADYAQAGRRLLARLAPDRTENVHAFMQCIEQLIDTRDVA